jgi:hypothetical protein
MLRRRSCEAVCHVHLIDWPPGNPWRKDCDSKDAQADRSADQQ